MPQQDVELILVRQLAETVSVAMLVVDADNDLVYFNEPAGRLIGRSFDEVSALSADERIRLFDYRDVGGDPVPVDRLPLVVAIRDGRPAHLRFVARALDGTVRDIEVTAFPLTAPGGHRVGAVALIWEAAAR